MTAVDLQSGPGPGADPCAGPDAGDVKGVEGAGLLVAYGDNLVLAGLDFTGLLGDVGCFPLPNGPGKTTPIRMLARRRELCHAGSDA